MVEEVMLEERREVELTEEEGREDEVVFDEVTTGVQTSFEEEVELIPADKGADDACELTKVDEATRVEELPGIEELTDVEVLDADGADEIEVVDVDEFGRV